MDHPILHLPPALATRNGGDATAAAPRLPALVLADLIRRKPSPLAEIELDHVLAVLDRQGQAVGENLGGLLRALQWARIDRVDPFFRQAPGYHGDFGPPPCGKPDSGQTPVDAAEDRWLAVPQQMKDRHVVMPPMRAARRAASPPDQWCPRYWSIAGAAR